MKTVAMFIAFQGFRDEEYVEPKKVLEAAGIKVVTVSTAKGRARGKFGAEAGVDKTVAEVDPSGYDALALVGGPGALGHLDNAQVHALFRKAAETGKLIGAICISPVVLAHAGLLKGKKVACFPDGIEEVKKAGGISTGSDLEVDGRLVTASGPAAAKDYGRALAKLLG